jgi:hypothetical protein
VQSFVKKNKVLVGVGCCGLGVVLAFFGYFFLDFVIFASATCATFLIISYGGLKITDNFYNKGQQPDWMLYTLFGCAALVGVLLGCCVKKIKDWGLAILAGCGGAALGMYICTMATIQ